jgi:hypothetical protein
MEANAVVVSQGASVIPDASPTPPASEGGIYVGNLPADERARVLKAMANAHGIRLPETRVPEGESLLPVGEENKRALQGEVNALPSVGDGLAALRARIASEAAIDRVVPIQRMRMEGTRGGLYATDPAKSLAYTPRGFGHAIDAIKPSHLGSGAVGGTLLALPTGLRAEVFNHFAQSTRGDGSNAVIRTIVDPRSGRRVLRAVTSEKHSLESGDDRALVDAIERAIPDGAKLRVTRTMDRTDLELIWPAMDREIRVGDVALIALSISNSETKAGAIKVAPKLLRVLCYNFTTAYSDGVDEEISLRHVGDLRLKLGPAIRRALAVVDPFVRAFGDAYKTALPDFAPTRGEVLERIGKVYELPSAVLDAAGQLWDRDGERSAGDTLAGVVNAMTRASQDQTMAKASETERAAGRLTVQGWAGLA